jgi:hypothetical protein
MALSRKCAWDAAQVGPELLVSAWPEPPSVIPAEWPAEHTAGARTKRNGTGVRSNHNQTPVSLSSFAFRYQSRQYSSVLAGVLRLTDWTKVSLPKATSLIASGETGPIHMAACGAASRDYVFDGPEL